MEGLGRLNDVQVAGLPVDLTTAGLTGRRVSLKNAGGVQFDVALAAAASGTESVVLTVSQHTAGSGGTTSNLLIDHYYIKVQTAGSEAWQRVNQTASQTITIADTTGTITGAAQKALVVAIEVDAQSLSDGYTHTSVSIADPGTVSRLGVVIANVRDLHVKRTPANLPALI